MKFNLPDKAKEVINAMQKHGFECYAVGGSVRDFFLGRETHDWDFTTNATPEEIQKVFPESFYDNSYGTVGIKIKNDQGETIEVYEITPYRAEGKYSDARHPDEVRWAETLEEDLGRRDFTINAMAVTVKDNQEEVVDPYKGTLDLEKKLIRAVGIADERFKEDALRLMRAVRLASQMGFQIEETTWEAIKKNAPSISKISAERIRDEFIKILAADYPADGIRLLHGAGLLEQVLPELVAGVGLTQKGTHHTDDVYTHSLKSLEFCKSDSWVVRLAALVHDIGKPPAHKERNGKDTFYNHEVIGAHIVKDLANRWHLSKEDREKLYTLVRWHMFSVSEFLTDAAIRRFIRRIGPENTSDMLDIRIADRLGSGSKESSWRLEQFKERIIEVQKHIPSVKDLKVNGQDIMETLEIGPGPKVGQILNQLFEEIIEDPDKNNREALLKRIKELA